MGQVQSVDLFASRENMVLSMVREQKVSDFNSSLLARQTTDVRASLSASQPTMATAFAHLGTLSVIAFRACNPKVGYISHGEILSKVWKGTFGY